MPMHYRHREDGEKRCYCPWCAWTGTLHETDEYKPDDGRESFQVCPKCAPERPVVPWPANGSSPNFFIKFEVIDEKDGKPAKGDPS